MITRERQPSGRWYRKTGYYYVRITYYLGNERKEKNYPTGIKIDPKKEKKQDREADKKVAEILARFVVPGSMDERRKQMFWETVAEWLERQKASKPESTYAGYRYAANDVMLYFRDVCPVKTTDLTSSMVEQYQNWEHARRQPGYTGEYKKNSKYKDGSGVENTIKHRTTLIRSVLQYAKRDGLVDRNVASSRDSHVSLPSPQHNLFLVLTLAEANRMMKLARDEALWFLVAVAMGLLIGLRRSEVIGAREEAINWDTCQIIISQTITQQTVDGENTLTVKPYTKNKKTKDLDLVLQLKDLLKALVEENRRNAEIFGKDYDHTWDGYLFKHPDGKLVTPDELTKKFAAFIKKHHLKPIRFHDLRHSCASILYANGVDILTIQKILGHAQLSTTFMYTHIINDQQNTALVQMGQQILGDDEIGEEN